MYIIYSPGLVYQLSSCTVWCAYIHALCVLRVRPCSASRWSSCVACTRCAIYMYTCTRAALLCILNINYHLVLCGMCSPYMYRVHCTLYSPAPYHPHPVLCGVCVCVGGTVYIVRVCHHHNCSPTLSCEVVRWCALSWVGALARDVGLGEVVAPDVWPVCLYTHCPHSDLRACWGCMNPGPWGRLRFWVSGYRHLQLL